MSLQLKEDVDDFILSCLASTPDERQELEEGIERRKESLKKGAFLCLKINERLKTNALEFVPTVDRLYFDDAFSFEAKRLGRNRTNSSDRPVNDLIRIQPSRFDDVQPSLFNVKAVFDVGNNREKSIFLDDVGEGVLKGLQPNCVCRLVRLETEFSIEERIFNTKTLPYVKPYEDQEYVDRLVKRLNGEEVELADDKGITSLNTYGNREHIERSVAQLNKKFKLAAKSGSRLELCADDKGITSLNTYGNREHIERSVAQPNKKFKLAAKSEPRLELCADDRSLPLTKPLWFNYGGSFVEAFIQQKDERCSNIQLFTEDESVLDKSSYCVFSDGCRYGFGCFTFSKGKKFYKADADVEIKYSNKVSVCDESSL